MFIEIIYIPVFLPEIWIVEPIDRYMLLGGRHSFKPILSQGGTCPLLTCVECLVFASPIGRVQGPIWSVLS